MATGLGDLRAASVALAGTDPAALSPAALADQVVELRQLIDGLEGIWSCLVAALDGSGATEAGTSAFLRSSCRLAPAAARARVVLARRLAERSAVGAALTAGEISVDHARVVTHALEELAAADGTLADDAEAPLLEAARHLDPARLRREIAHARHALAPDATAAADETTHSRRHLDVATTFEGMVAVSGMLTPEGGELLLTALTPLSGPAGPDDVRTPGQRRADALVDLCHRQLDHAGLPTVSGERPHLTVLVPLPALTPSPALSRLTATNSATPTDIPDRSGAFAPTCISATRTGSSGQTGVPGPTGVAGRTDSPGRAGSPGHHGVLGSTGVPSPTDSPGPTGVAGPTGVPDRERTAGSVVDGGQPGWWTGVGRSDLAVTGEATWGAVLGPQAVRRIACDASVIRVVLDPAGQPLDVGRRTRVVPPAIRTALTVRDRGCAYPGCDRGPQWTDAHHVRHWADGGSTSLDNLVLLCRHHHRAVHEGRAPLPHAPPRAA